MRTSNNVVWRSLEKWSAVFFLVAGTLVLISTAATGVEWLTGATGLTDGPLDVAAFFGMVLSYVGLLGLYPKLADDQSRLSQVSVLLLLVPVAVIIVDLVSILLGGGPPFGLTIASIAFLLFALGIALFGVASLRTHDTSNAMVGSCWRTPVGGQHSSAQDRSTGSRYREASCSVSRWL